MNYAKELDRKELVLAVWAAEFARRMGGSADAIEGPVLRIMTEQAAASADRLVKALRLLIEVTFRPIPEDDQDNDCYMTWESFVCACESGGFVDDDGFGELATIDLQVSNVRIQPSEARNQGFVRPPWATHVCWYNK